MSTGNQHERRGSKSQLRQCLRKVQQVTAEFHGDLDAMAAMLDAELIAPAPGLDEEKVAHAVDVLIPQIESAVRKIIEALSVAFGVNLDEVVEL